LSFDFDFWRQSLKQSFPLAVSGILIMIYFSTDSLFLSIFRPAADVGVYRLSYKILESSIFFPAMFVGLVMPPLCAAAFADWARFKEILQRAQDILLVFAVPLVLGTFMLSDGIIGLLGGNQYPESAIILNILIVAVGLIFLGTLFSYVLIALEKQKALLWISLMGAVFNVAFNLTFIPRYSYWAAALSTVATEAMVTILMMAVVWRTIKCLPTFKVGLKAGLAGLIMAGFLKFFGSANFFLLIVLAPIIATLIQLAISRKREFLADASGALLTRYPDGLASALQKISASNVPMARANHATAHLYIANPFKDKSAMSFMNRLFMTHPPTEDRVGALLGH